MISKSETVSVEEMVEYSDKWMKFRCSAITSILKADEIMDNLIGLLKKLGLLEYWR